MARKKQDSLKAIATQVVKPKETQATPAKKRVGRQDVKTPVRSDVTLRAEELNHGGRLTKAAFAQHCGRGAIKFTPAVAKKLIDINNRNWGALSFKRLAGKLAVKE